MSLAQRLHKFADGSLALSDPEFTSLVIPTVEEKT
jgi:hypothetical protein